MPIQQNVRRDQSGNVGIAVPGGSPIEESLHAYNGIVQLGPSFPATATRLRRNPSTGVLQQDSGSGYSDIGGGLSGGAANRIGIWSGSNSMTYDDDLTYDPTTNILYLNGKMGIGTASAPDDELEVKGSIEDDNISVSVRNTGVNNSVAAFWARNELDYSMQMSIQDSVTNDPLWYAFRLGRGLLQARGGSPGMSIVTRATNSSIEWYFEGLLSSNLYHRLNKVGWGIGQQTIDEKMNLNGGMRFSNTVGNLTSSAGCFLGFDSSGQFAVRNFEAGPVKIYTADQERARFGSTGGFFLSNGFASFSGVARKFYIYEGSSGRATMTFMNSTTGTNADTDGFVVGLGADEHALILQKEAQPIEFWTSNTLQMSILANGDHSFTDGLSFVFGTTTGHKFGTATSQKMGFFNATPVTQRTVTALTDNSGGTANDTVQALTDPADAPADADALREDLVANLIPELRNNIADLAAKINELRTSQVQLGFIAA